MDAAVQQKQQELNDCAYYALLKVMILADLKKGMGFATKLRPTLNIDNAQHGIWLKQLIEHKKTGMPDPGPHGSGLARQHSVANSAGVPTTGAGARGHGGMMPAAAAANPAPQKAWGQQQAGAGGGMPMAAAARPGAGAKKRKDVPPYLGMKVSRHWPTEGGWFEAVITDYSEDNTQYCLTYYFGQHNEEYEWLNLESLGPDFIRYLNERVNLLQYMPTSRAVQTSGAVQLYLGGGGGGGGSKSKSKKRKSEDDGDAFD